MRYSRSWSSSQRASLQSGAQTLVTVWPQCAEPLLCAAAFNAHGGLEACERGGGTVTVDMSTSRAADAGLGLLAPEVPCVDQADKWDEQQLLETATSMPALSTIRHQARALRQRTGAILRKRLQHRTRCQAAGGSLQAEHRAALWAWLEPTLLVRVCGECEEG